MKHHMRYDVFLMIESNVVNINENILKMKFLEVHVQTSANYGLFTSTVLHAMLKYFAVTVITP